MANLGLNTSDWTRRLDRCWPGGLEGFFNDVGPARHVLRTLSREWRDRHDARHPPATNLARALAVWDKPTPPLRDYARRTAKARHILNTWEDDAWKAITKMSRADHLTARTLRTTQINVGVVDGVTRRETTIDYYLMTGDNWWYINDRALTVIAGRAGQTTLSGHRIDEPVLTHGWYPLAVVIGDPAHARTSGYGEEPRIRWNIDLEALHDNMRLC